MPLRLLPPALPKWVARLVPGLRCAPSRLLLAGLTGTDWGGSGVVSVIAWCRHRRSVVNEPGSSVLCLL